MSLPADRPKLPVAVSKATPYTFDLGMLLANDPNPLALGAADIEGSLAATARDGAQALINQLLTTCAVSATEAGVLLSLPPASTPLPREKPVPQPKAPTRWESFAARRGIKPKTREQRRNASYNEATGEWQRKWGYNGANKNGEKDWIVEVDPRKEAALKDGATVRGEGRRERKERVRRQERRERRNLREAEEKKKR